MKAEEQILELLAEVLRRQDKTQETLQEMSNRLGNVEVRLGNVEENQVAHQQILRTLALGQQKHQRELEDILGILATMWPGCSAIRTAGSTTWNIPATLLNLSIRFVNN